MFPNGYGISVVQLHYMPKDTPYEIAVLTKYGITYDTPITGDVEHSLSLMEVVNYTYQVSNLKE